MSPVVKNTIAIVVGIVVGGLVNMGIVMLGPTVIPVPDGVDMMDMAKLADNIKLLKPVNFIPPFLAHALGTLVGAFVAAKLAASRKMICAIAIGAFFAFGGIKMVVDYGGPVWFIVLDLVVAYLPMGYLGGVLASANKRGS